MKHIQIIFISFLLIILNYALFNTTSNQFASTDNIIELQRTILNIRIYLILIIVLSLFSYRKFIAQNLKLSENTKAKLFMHSNCIFLLKQKAMQLDIPMQENYGKRNTGIQ